MTHCGNQSIPSHKTVFILLGFPALQETPLPLFFTVLALYTFIVVGNVLILVAVVGDPRLHKPMYFFLCNLSAVDILFTTTTVPKMLAMFLFQHNTISFEGCFLQMYSFHSLGVMESFILVVMAYDRYEAICHPLHYPVRMTPQANARLAASAWAMALVIPAPVMVETSQLEYTARATVEHCFCDHLAVVRAACQDAGTEQQTFIGFCIAMTVSLVPLFLVLFSYGKILASILRIASQEGRAKAFSTCTSHLMVVEKRTRHQSERTDVTTFYMQGTGTAKKKDEKIPALKELMFCWAEKTCTQIKQYKYKYIGVCVCVCTYI
uniref:G-protein coupled receptors family 1 profile domain-containing protein n=1 Tax=Monodelphis domestica TaxID=13616 RepID=F6UEM6_MONDO